MIRSRGQRCQAGSDVGDATMYRPALCSRVTDGISCVDGSVVLNVARQQSLAVRLVDSTLQAVVLRTNQVATVMVATARIADAAQTSAM